MKLPDKAAVHAALRAALAERLDLLVRSAEDARAGATHEENRQEGAKDMRATEQSYIARGQAMRAEDRADELARLDAFALPSFGDDDPIAAGALVHLSLEEGRERVLYLLAAGAGTVLRVDGVEVTVVTPSAPLGRHLLGLRVGDAFELRVRGAQLEHVVEDVA